MNLHDFIHMSGYAAYVWSCYGLTLAVLVWLAWNSRRELTKELERARRRAQTEQPLP